MKLTPLATGFSKNLTFADQPPTNQPYSQPAGTNINYYPNARSRFAGLTYGTNNYTFVFTGYFAPPVTGTYNFCIYADNIINLYTGPVNAFQCGSNTAPVGAASYKGTWPQGTVCQKTNYTTGYLYPIRGVFGNHGLPGSLNLTITFPGQTRAADLSNYLYPQSCT